MTSTEPLTRSERETAFLQEVRKALAELGPNLRSVTEAMRVGGFTGLRTRPCECPVSRYLAQRLAPARAALPLHCKPARLPYVGRGDVLVCVGTQEERVPLPEPVRLFISAFDGGHIPELVESPPRIF